MPALGIVAMDLPAALECGALLANEGQRVGLDSTGDADAMIRVLPREGGAAEATALCDALLAAGATRLLLLTGPGFDDPRIGPVADALRRRLHAGFAPVAPAFPARGRSLYLGHLFDGTALAPGEPSLPRRLAAWCGVPVGLIPFATMEAGAPAIRQAMSRLADGGRDYGVADGATDGHLRALVEAAAAYPLLIGGAGLGAAGLMSVATPEPWPVPEGAWAVIAGSAARNTLAQIGFARLHGPVLDLDGPDADGALAWATPLLSGEHPVIVAAAEAAYGALPAIAEGLVARGVGRLLVAGEAVFEPLLHRLAPDGLVVGPEAAEATPWCVAAGRPLQIAFKPGERCTRDVLLRVFLPN